MQWTVVGLVGLLGLTSFAVSFRALHDVAAWAGIGPGLQWAVPVFIDGAILTYALAVLVHRSRGESVWPSWVSLAVFTAMSVAANAAHAVSVPQAQWWQTLVGAALAALAPLGVFAATEQMARLVVLRPQDRRQAAPVEDLPVEEAQEDEGSAVEAKPTSSLAEEPTAVTSEPRHVAVGAETSERPRPEESAPAQDDQPVEGAAEQAAEASDKEEHAAEAVVPAVAPAPAQATDESAESEPSEEDFAAWVRERRREGEPITGSTAGGFLGVSERTGRNRIKELRAARPELFEEDAA